MSNTSETETATTPTSPKAEESPKKEKDTKMIGNYIIGEKLGEGAFAKVRKGTHSSTGEEVALKFINLKMNPKIAERMKREVNIMKLLNHPHVIKLYEVIPRGENEFCLVLEYAKGGDLFDKISSNGGVPESEAAKYFCQILNGLDYCHKMSVAHRDLKPENILLDEHGNIKITDFGLSNIFTRDINLRTSCGSPLYVAPEVSKGDYKPEGADIWSLGVCLYAMVTGCNPWMGSTLQEQIASSLQGRFFKPHASAEFWHLIVRMLEVDVEKRALLSEVKEHRWLAVFAPKHELARLLAKSRTRSLGSSAFSLSSKKLESLDLAASILDKQITDKEESSLKVSKNAFTSNVASFAPVEEIKADIQRALKLLNVSFEWNTKKPTCKCATRIDKNEMEFKIEIVRVHKLDGLKAVILKLGKGKKEDWKLVENRLVKEFHL